LKRARTYCQPSHHPNQRTLTLELESSPQHCDRFITRKSQVSATLGCGHHHAATTDRPTCQDGINYPLTHFLKTLIFVSTSCAAKPMYLFLNQILKTRRVRFVYVRTETKRAIMMARIAYGLLYGFEQG